MKRFVPLFLAIVLALGAIGCGGSSSSPDESIDATGNWTMTETLVENTCGFDLTSPLVWTGTIAQSGSAITIENDYGVSFSGTLDTSSGAFSITWTTTSDDLTGFAAWSGTFSSDGGCDSEASFVFYDSTGGSCVVRTTIDGQRD